MTNIELQSLNSLYAVIFKQGKWALPSVLPLSEY